MGGVITICACCIGEIQLDCVLLDIVKNSKHGYFHPRLILHLELYVGIMCSQLSQMCQNHSCAQADSFIE